MSRRRLQTTSRLVLAFVLMLAALPAAASGRLLQDSAPVQHGQPLAVTLLQPTPAISPAGHLRVKVTVALPEAAEYAEVRLRLKRPDGRRIYQKTEVRQGLPAGEHAIEFDYDIAPAELPQGRYPLEVRVAATGAKTTSVLSRLLVIDPATARVPVALVVTARDLPAYDADGRVARDPATPGSLREHLSSVATLVQERSAQVGFAVPPVLLEENARLAAGYETTAGATVKAADPSALRSARLAAALKSAVTTGTVDLIDVPYALPDAAVLRGTGASEDFALQWAATDAVRAPVLSVSAGPSMAYFGRTLTDEALASLAGRPIACILAHPASLRRGNTNASPGAYTLPGTHVRALVLDDAAAAAAGVSAEAFYDALFAHLEDGSPAVVLLEVGPEGAHDPLDVQHALDWVDAADWLRLMPAPALVTSIPAGEATLISPSSGEAPSAYRAALERDRQNIVGYASAVDAGDADATAVTRSLLVAESGLWAGSDGRWSAAARAEAYLESARQWVATQFGLVVLDTKDVTLSGSKGDVPLTLINNTGKHLDLTLSASSSAGTVVTATQAISAQPTQNLLTIPVDLGNANADTLNVRVTANGVLVTETSISVRASYLDRLGVIAIVVLVLAGLLLYIRKRVKIVDAGTITSGNSVAGGPEESTR